MTSLADAHASKEADSLLPTQASISRSTFSTLPIDIQLNYARFHGLSYAVCLTTEQISDALFKDTEWILALDRGDHLELGTATGERVIVGREAMYIVERPVEHPRNSSRSPSKVLHPAAGRTRFEADDAMEGIKGTLANITPVFEESVGRFPPYNVLDRMVEDLQSAHARIKAAVEESRKAARDVCAEVFILQSQLQTEKYHQSSLNSEVTNIAGMQLMQGHLAQCGVLEKEYPQERMETIRTVVSTMKPTPESSNRNLPLPPFHHVLSPPTLSMGSKRNRVDDDSFQELESPHRPKRLRVGEPPTATNHHAVVPRTILTYSSDNGTDDTYSDSEGTERDFIDDPDSSLDACGSRPMESELSFLYSSEESSGDEIGTPADHPPHAISWGTLPDFDDEPSDSDYHPLDWDLEDIWEFDSMSWSIGQQCELDTWALLNFNFGNEVDECGGLLSDSGLSTDDPDEGYHIPGVIQHPSFRTPASLPKHLRSIAPWTQAWNDLQHGRITEARFKSLKEHKSEQNRESRWRRFHSKFVVKGGYPSLDLEERISNLLDSDHSHFGFDDEEWKHFAEPQQSYRTIIM